MPPYPTQDRLVAKEVALGTLRELAPPTTHIGLQLLAPYQDVATDDVIFDYMKGLTQEGLAPARAEDAESELAQKDVTAGGVGRASIIDWAIKDHYTASDVTRYRESLLLAQLAGANAASQIPLTLQSARDQFSDKVARDDALRKRKLDNRMEWLIMTSLETSAIAYNDGKIKFGISWGRPAQQTNQAPGGGLWSLQTSDPIGDILAVQEYMYNLYGVRIRRAITSKKVLNQLVNSDRFIARSGMVGATGAAPIDLNYVMDGWGPSAARQVVERATGLQFIEYDSVYRTRPIGSNTVTNVRFLSENKVYFLPDEADIADLEDGMLGFGKTLTSPHPEGEWASGFYEWEQDTKDPWGTDRGTGIKAFPIFPHMELTYTATVL